MSHTLRHAGDAHKDTLCHTDVSEFSHDKVLQELSNLNKSACLSQKAESAVLRCSGGQLPCSAAQYGRLGSRQGGRACPPRRRCLRSAGPGHCFGEKGVQLRPVQRPVFGNVSMTLRLSTQRDKCIIYKNSRNFQQQNVPRVK